MFDFVTQNLGTLDEVILKPAHYVGIFSSYALHSNFLLLAGSILVAVLIAFLLGRQKASMSHREMDTNPKGTSPLTTNPAGTMVTFSAAQGHWRQRASLGLSWKIVKTFAGTTLLVGFLIIGSVYSVMVDAVQRQVNQRALMIATNLSDTAVTHVRAKDVRALHGVLVQYAQLKEVAYVLVEDRKGKVLGDSLGGVTSDLASLLGGPDLRAARRTPTALAGKKLYDTRVPLLNGEIGAVHVGIWQSAVDSEVNQALLPIIGLLLIILIVTVMLASGVAKRISKPILSLAWSADQISKGELDLPVGVASNDELGELGRSIERLRASLKAAMIRLNHRES